MHVCTWGDCCRSLFSAESERWKKRFRREFQGWEFRGADLAKPSPKECEDDR